MDNHPSRTLIEELLTQASWMQSFARSVTRDEAEAEDLAQDTWVAALAHRPRTDRGLRPWLATVLKNLAIERQRKPMASDLPATPSEDEIEPATDEVVLRAELSTRVAQAVLNLPEPARTTVLWRYAEGLPAAEIARRTQTSAGTIRSRLKRALDELRVVLDDAELARAEKRSPGRFLAAFTLRRSEWIAAWKGGFAVSMSIKLAVPVLALAVLFLVIPEGSIEIVGPERRPALAVESTASPDTVPSTPPIQQAPAAARTELVTEGGLPEVPWRALAVDATTGEPVPFFAAQLQRGERVEELHTNEQGEWTSSTPWAAGSIRVSLFDALLDFDLMGGERAFNTGRVVRDIEFDPTAPPTVFEVDVGPSYRLEVSGAPGLSATDITAGILNEGRSNRGSLRECTAAPIHRDSDGLWVRFPSLERPAYLLDPAAPWSLEVRSRAETWFGEAQLTTLEGSDQPIRIRLFGRSGLRVSLLDPGDAQPRDTDLRLRRTASDEVEHYDRSIDWGPPTIWSFRNLTPGAYEIELSGLRIETETKQVVLADHAWTDVAITTRPLPTVGSISGLLVSRSGQFDEDVSLSIRHTETSKSATQRAHWIEVQGRKEAPFSFEELPIGEYEVRVWSPSSNQPWDRDAAIVSAPTDDLRFTLDDTRASSDFAFRVIDAETGEEFERFSFAAAQDWSEAPTCWSGVFQGHVAKGIDPEAEFLWAVTTTGCRTVFGTKRDLIPWDPKNPSTINTIALEQGWTGRIRAGQGNEPLGDVEVLIEGQLVGRTDRHGLLVAEWPEWPTAITVRKDGWVVYSPPQHVQDEGEDLARLWIRAGLQPE